MSGALAAYVGALEHLGGLGRFGMRLGLESMTRLLSRLGEPHLRYPVLHVAGTNGKGATSHALASILRAAGLRVGLYTSPHLLRFTERIVVDGHEVTRAETAALCERVRVAAGELPITFFEHATAMAFAHFADAAVDVAVVEVGLGGRLDATNVVTPMVSIITSIGLEHREQLGDTLGAIAREKAGIIKGGRPVVLGEMAPEARDAIVAVAAERGSPVHVFGRELSARREPVGENGERFWYRGSTHGGRLALPLRGGHQVVNAALAAYAAELSAGFGLPVQERHIAEGLAVTHVPGRFLEIRGEPALLLDTAHNPPAMVALGKSLEERFAGRPRALVLGVLEDKDHLEMLSAVSHGAQAVFALRPESPRARAPEDVVTAARELGLRASVSPDIDAALGAARAEVGPGGLVVVTGSFYTVALAMKRLGIGGEPDPIALGDPVRVLK